jgi:hypothetical protein
METRKKERQKRVRKCLNCVYWVTEKGRIGSCEERPYEHWTEPYEICPAHKFGSAPDNPNLDHIEYRYETPN